MRVICLPLKTVSTSPVRITITIHTLEIHKRLHGGIIKLNAIHAEKSLNQKTIRNNNSSSLRNNNSQNYDNQDRNKVYTSRIRADMCGICCCSRNDNRKNSIDRAEFDRTGKHVNSQSYSLPSDPQSFDLPNLSIPPPNISSQEQYNLHASRKNHLT